MSGTGVAVGTATAQAQACGASSAHRGRPGASSDTALDGEPAAVTAEGFEAFYRRSFPEVYRYLASRCSGSRSVAEDLTQETYLAAVTAIKDGRTDVSMPWLMGVARHKLVDHYRRQEREARKLSLITNDRSSGPLSIVVEEYSADRVVAALDGLPAIQRAAVILRYLDDLPVSEVASVLGKSVHATESLLARGRTTLRRRDQEATDD